MDHHVLQAYLETRGLADTDGVRRRAHYTRCPSCAAPVLTGLDADTGGLPRVCDTTDLDRLAEFTTLAHGIPTLTVLELPDGLRLGRRHTWSITADRQDRPVVAEHRCDHPSPTSTAFRWRIPAASTTTDNPPF